MILSFIRNEDKSLNVVIKNGDQIEDFSYPVFIDYLYKNSVIEAPEFPDDITETEREKIEGMIKQINDIVLENRTQENDEDNGFE